MPSFILLVEDTDDDAELTTRAFERAGVSTPVVRVSDGGAALRHLVGKRPSELPAAVLLDLNMPQVGGLEVLDAIQKDTVARNVPVIVMTTSQDDEDRLLAYNKGAVAFVRKPLDFAAFEQAAKTVDVHWSVLLSVFGSSET